MITSSRMWKAGTGLVLVGALAAACTPGNRTVVRGSTGSTGATPVPVTVQPVTVQPVTVQPAVQPVVPAEGPTQDPQVTADSQAADQTLSQIESDLPTMDQATNSGENDVPSK